MNSTISLNETKEKLMTSDFSVWVLKDAISLRRRITTPRFCFSGSTIIAAFVYNNFINTACNSTYLNIALRFEGNSFEVNLSGI